MDVLIARTRAARPATKTAGKKPNVKSAPVKKPKPDARTRRFLDAVMGLKL